MKTAILDQNVCEEIGQVLSQTLADTYLLYTKTQNFHWNVEDPRFFTLHGLFQHQYEALAEAADDLAERLRTLGLRSPGSFREFLDIASLEESEGYLSGDEMLEQLLFDHEQIANKIRPQISGIQKLGDEGTADLLIERLRFHEKTAWILRSHFTKGRRNKD